MRSQSDDGESADDIGVLEKFRGVRRAGRRFESPYCRGLIHLHPRHGGVVHIVVSLIVIVCGPDFLRVVSYGYTWTIHPNM